MEWNEINMKRKQLWKCKHIPLEKRDVCLYYPSIFDIKPAIVVGYWKKGLRGEIPQFAWYPNTSPLTIVFMHQMASGARQKVSCELQPCAWAEEGAREEDMDIFPSMVWFRCTWTDSSEPDAFPQGEMLSIGLFNWATEEELQELVFSYMLNKNRG